MSLNLNDIQEFDFIEEVKKSSLAYYQGRAEDRREATSQTSSGKEKARLLSLAADD